MANSFATIGAMGGTKIKKFKVPKVSDRFPAEVSQENRRLTGVTPKLVKGYQESPARFLPRAHFGSMLKAARK